MNSGMSVPNVGQWLSPSVVGEEKVANKDITVKDGNTQQDKHFIVYYTHGGFPPRENMPIKLREGKLWCGELAVFRRAVNGNRLINFRSDQGGAIAWEVIHAFAQLCSVMAYF
jgi:hypothetical protein